MSSQRWSVLWVGLVDAAPIALEGRTRHPVMKTLHVEHRGSGADALEALSEHEWDVCVVESDLGRERGIDLLRAIRERAPELAVLYVRPIAAGSNDAAVLALGAVDCLDQETLADGEWLRAVRYAVECRRLEHRLAASDERLLHQSRHDWLTGLPNRLLFVDRVQETLERQPHHRDGWCAVLCLDLDRFQVICDSLGHRQADELLIAVGRRLASCLEIGATLARFGGDEFAILLPEVADARAAIALAGRIQRQLVRAFQIDGSDVFTSASIGIAVASDELRSVDDLIRAADLAMYRAKRQGKMRHELYDPEMHEQATKRHQVEVELRRALDQGELRLFFQPILDLEAGRVAGFEGLVRWLHPARGLLAPAEFLQVAEETGLIVPIGRFVLGEACRQMAEWNARFAHGPARYVAVNLSAKEFMQWDLPGRVQRMLDETGLPADCLKIEITEGVLQETAPTPGEVLDELKTLGVDLFIDDFGTGYSSLSALHRYPIDALKIDRAFVSRMIEDERSDAIVRTILALADHLGMQVVAEGVETEAQCARLKELGCRQAQGYLFSKPLAADEAEEYLRRDALPDLARAA